MDVASAVDPTILIQARAVMSAVGRLLSGSCALRPTPANKGFLQSILSGNSSC